MNQVLDDKRFIILTGNYGSGKTELALNLALYYADSGLRTTLVDLDIVNPYFRSGEKSREMENAGVRMLMPTFALTTVDIPALPAEIQSVFELPSDKVIFDVGHQSYTWKILTGRADEFDTLRDYGGLSGFPKRRESKYDSFNTGHSSTSISAGLGFVHARDLMKKDYHVISGL